MLYFSETKNQVSFSYYKCFCNEKQLFGGITKTTHPFKNLNIPTVQDFRALVDKDSFIGHKILDFVKVE